MILPSLLLHVSNGLLGNLASAGVGFAALTANGQAAAMTGAAIAADLRQTLDVQRHLTAQIALDHILVVNGLTELVLLGLGQILDAGVRVDACFRQDVLCALSANTIDLGQTDFASLILGQVNTGNTCHTFKAPPLST